MAQPSIEIADLLSATECGATCAVAGLTQRDLLRCAAAYPDLFPARPFDPAFFSTIASANAFCAPWLSADRLRITNRITLWVFGLDRLIDHVSTTPAEVDDIVRRCLSAAAGTPSGDPLTGFLAEVRAELAGTPSFAALHDVWYDELRRMLAAMAREWRWRMTGRLPTLDSYLDNAEFGFSVVYVSHWIATTEPEDISDTAQLRAAGQAVQRVIRLLNDLGTYQREMQTGDLNALRLADRQTVEERIAIEAAHSRTLLAPLTPVHPRLVLFLRRQIDFNTGFYRITDYQGELDTAPGAASPREPSGRQER